MGQRRIEQGVKLGVILSDGPRKILLSQKVVEPLQIPGSRIAGEPPYRRGIVNEEVDPCRAQTADPRVDVIERETDRSWQFPGDESFPRRASLVANANPTSEDRTLPSQSNEFTRPNQRELPDFHVRGRKADSARSFRCDRQATHDDVDFAGFECIDEPGQRVAFKDDAPIEGLCNRSSQIRLDTQDFAILFENHWWVGRRDAHTQGISIGEGHSPVIGRASSRERQDEK